MKPLGVPIYEHFRCDIWLRKQRNFDLLASTWFTNDVESLISAFNRYGFNDECMSHGHGAISEKFPFTYIGIEILGKSY